jgi:pilus assembly protein Flp/PilA
MERLNKWYVRLQESQKGQTMAEYGLIVAAVAVICIAAYQLLGTNVSAQVNALAAAI